MIIQLRGNLGNQIYQYVAALEMVGGDPSNVLIDTRLCLDYGAYALPLVFNRKYLRHANMFDLVSVGEIPIRTVGFRTLSTIKDKLFDPFATLKSECGWYGKYSNAMQSKLEGRTPKFMKGMFQQQEYYTNARRLVSLYGKEFSSEKLYDLAISLRQGEDYRVFATTLGKSYYSNVVDQIEWDCVRSVAITGDVLPSWDIFSLIPDGINVDNYVGEQTEIQFSVLQGARQHILANSTFSWWATVFGQARQHNSRCFVPEDWFSVDQVRFVGATCVSSVDCGDKTT